MYKQGDESMKHLSLKEKAYELIKQKIINGDFEPGSRMMEEALAEEISMSRTPVREAINQLSSEGLIENIPRKGIFFTLVSKEETKDLLDLRITLESLAVKKCIEKLNQQELQILESNVSEFKKALDIEDYKKCNELDSLFHSEIANISGNKKLIKFLKEVEDFMLIARTLEKMSSPKVKNDLTIEDHVEILEAIKRKDAEAAVNSIVKNINRMRKNLVD
jgi:DNA-binding GntR family transcriptional regulator